MKKKFLFLGESLKRSNLKTSEMGKLKGGDYCNGVDSCILPNGNARLCSTESFNWTDNNGHVFSVCDETIWGCSYDNDSKPTALCLCGGDHLCT
ncbi:MAG: hypothetical protein QM528_06220 [Phycisphaerales bacterium]|nr:hypothetical protein [Phycisphaerales bacterium]